MLEKKQKTYTFWIILSDEKPWVKKKKNTIAAGTASFSFCSDLFFLFVLFTTSVFVCVCVPRF